MTTSARARTQIYNLGTVPDDSAKQLSLDSATLRSAVDIVTVSNTVEGKAAKLLKSEQKIDINITCIVHNCQLTRLQTCKLVPTQPAQPKTERITA